MSGELSKKYPYESLFSPQMVRNVELIEEVATIAGFESKMEALLNILKAHDVGTFEHSLKVLAVTREILRLGQLEIPVLEIAAPLHDIGKLFVGRRALNRYSNTQLLDGEYQSVLYHGPMSREILHFCEFPNVIADTAGLHAVDYRLVAGRQDLYVAGFSLPSILRVTDTLAAIFDTTRLYQPRQSPQDVKAQLLRKALPNAGVYQPELVHLIEAYMYEHYRV